MFKNIIAPVQAWLLSQGRCVGCGNQLKNGRRIKKDNTEEQITCSNCGRIFIYNREKNIFRRAPISDDK